MNSLLDDQTLHLPRILCLHGGGVNSRVFRMQCRVLIAHLQGSFRLCFADAPFVCGPGPGMVPTYQNYGPFRRWLRWRPEHPEIERDTASQAIYAQLTETMVQDDQLGATGEWVGLLGFSQGAKMAASLLLMQDQVQQGQLANESDVSWGFRFAVLMAGSAPLVTLDPHVISSPYLADTSQSTATTKNFPDEHDSRGKQDHLLQSATVHVHGRMDPGIDLHRRLLEQYCDKGTAQLVEWDGDHRVPIKRHDVAALVAVIEEVARKTGVLASQVN